MTLLVVNNGEVVALSYLTNKVATTRDLIYRLFSNNVTPAETDTAATYTEVTGGGYAQKSLAGASWTVTGGNPTTASFAAQTWTFTGAIGGSGTVFGYYVIRATDVDLVLAETFTSFTPATNGDNIILTPNITAE